VEIETHLDKMNQKSDRMMLLLVILHAFFATFISSISYATYALGAISSVLLVIVTLIAYRFFKGERTFRIIVALVLMTFSAIYIQQHLGRIEFHFHIFVGISFLTIYKDYIPTIVAGLASSLYHIVFNYLQVNNIMIFDQPLYIFNYACGWDIVWLHILFIMTETVLLTLVIIRGKERYEEVMRARNRYHKLSQTLESEVAKRTDDVTNLNELYKKSQEITHLGNWEWDIKSHKLRWNDEIYRIFGLDPQSVEPTYETFLSFIHVDDRDKVQQSVKNAIEHNINYDTTHRLTLLDNSTKYVRERGKVFRDESGEAIRMLGTVQDITTEFKIKHELEQSEKKFRIMSEHTTTGIFIFNEKFVYANQAMERITGYSQDELTQMSPQGLMPKADREKADHNIQRRLKGEHFDDEFPALTIFTKDGTQKVVSIHASTIEYDGTSAGLGSMVDITEVKQAQRELKTLSQVVEQTDDIVKITTEDGVLTYVNDAFVAHTGYTRREVIGHKPTFLKSGKHDKAFYADLWNTILAGEDYRAILINRKKDGSLYYEEQTISPILDDHGQISSFVSTGKDITDRMLLEEKLTEMAMKDKLTNIYNRHKFDELLNEEYERFKRHQRTLSLVMLDIDHFKRVNDTYGHDVGDLVLVEFCNLIKNCIRKLDKFARWGGEEFMILCPEAKEEDVIKLAQKIRILIENHQFETVGTVTVSAGVTTLNEKDDIKIVLKRLDKALYQAKSNGRNCVVQL
jgi:diguanylate cyclase (GGDEF)-like protein/PAS domain S-box-containing protein